MSEMRVRLKNRDLVINKLLELRKRTSPDSPSVHMALTRVALLISNQAKLNIRRKNIIDTGRLLNSIRYEFLKDDVSGSTRLLVGSFGVPYAAIHEFGGLFKDNQRRAMFASLRDRGKLQSGKNKNVIKGGKFGARPYLTPAYKLHRSKIEGIILEAITSGLS